MRSTDASLIVVRNSCKELIFNGLKSQLGGQELAQVPRNKDTHILSHIMNVHDYSLRTSLTSGVRVQTIQIFFS